MLFPAKTFHAIRHAETVANSEGTVAGSFDSPLTKIGYLQAKNARDIVEALCEKPSIIASSNLARARLTADVINANLRLPIIESELIAERHLGEWTGISVGEWRRRRKANLAPPGGETNESFESRVIRGFKEILDLNQTVLFVTHAGVLRVIFAHLGMKVVAVENCALHTFTRRSENESNPWIARPHWKPRVQA